MQRLLDFIFNIHKLWSKKYFVIFFHKDALPEAGTKITVGEMEAEFKKILEEGMELKIDNKTLSSSYDFRENVTQFVKDNPEVFDSWECRKCHKTQAEEPIRDMASEVLQCNNCGFRTVKE